MKVAFLESRDLQGHVIPLEPGGRFGHLAISFQNQWLHAHPFYGVQLASTDDLKKMGHLALILELPDRPELTWSQIQPFLGVPFDHKFSWSNESYYCSELVGKILGLTPEPMDFSLPIWPPEVQKYHGQLGLSPDDIFRKLSTAHL